MEFRVIRVIENGLTYDVQIQVLPEVKLLGVTLVRSFGSGAIIPTDAVINRAFHELLDSED